MTNDMNLHVGHMPEGHLVVGYVAHIKVMDDNGELYFATRVNGLNDMEMLGMAQDMATSFGAVLNNGKNTVEDD
jgi:hypothetical protein